MIRSEQLPTGWDIRPLGDVVFFLDHLRKPITQSERKAGNYPYYGANGQQGTINGFIFDEPLVLLAEDGGHFGTEDKTIAYSVEGKCWVNNHAHVLRPNKSIDFRFLARQLEQYNVSKFLSGSTRAKLTKGNAAKIPIGVPPLEEQKRIAAILDKADAIRRKRQQAMALADTFLRSVFLDMFGDPVTNPKGWDEAPLNTIAIIGSGATKGKKYQNQTLVDIPYMRVANVQDGWINTNDVQNISVSKTDAKKYALEKGDLLLTEGGDPDKLGRGAVWDGSIAPCIHQNHIFKVRFDKSIALPEFASFLIGSARGKRYFLRAAKQTTGIATINKTQLSVFPMIIPPMEMQRKFFNILQTAGETKHTLTSATVQTKNMFRSLQQRAFSGKM